MQQETILCLYDGSGNTQSLSKAEAIKRSRVKESQSLSALAAKWLEDAKTVTKSSNAFGLTMIRTIWGISPTADMAARMRDGHHVIVIADSLNSHGVQQYNVIVLIFIEDIEKHPSLSLDDLDFTPFLDDEKSPVPMYFIAGDHTGGAMQLLHTQKPLAKKWKYMLVTLAICNDTPENRRLAQIAGDLDNKVGNIKQEMTTFDYIEQIHRKYLQLIKKHGDPKVAANLKAINKELVSYKAECTITMGARGRIATATLGTFFQIAKRTGEVWDLIQSIFKEHKANLYATARGRTLTPKDHLGHSYFTDMANIPEDFLIKWLSNVMNKKYTVSQFKQKCTKYKKIMVLQKAILQWWSAEYHEEYDEYDELAKVHPFLATSSFVSEVIGVFNPTKKDPKINMTIVKIIQDRLRLSSASRDRVRLVSATIHIQACLLFMKNSFALFFIN